MYFEGKNPCCRGVLKGSLTFLALVQELDRQQARKLVKQDTDRELQEFQMTVHRINKVLPDQASLLWRWLLLRPFGVSPRVPLASPLRVSAAPFFASFVCACGPVLWQPSRAKARAAQCLGDAHGGAMLGTLESGEKRNNTECHRRCRCGVRRDGTRRGNIESCCLVLKRFVIKA
jgi:hypothetical protein